MGYFTVFVGVVEGLGQGILAGGDSGVLENIRNPEILDKNNTQKKPYISAYRVIKINFEFFYISSQFFT
jgi:hypothetical protein